MKKKKAISILTVLFCAVLVYGAAITSSPWDGTGWNTSAPNDEALEGNTYKELQDLRKGVGIRLDKEHETLASSSAGGVHKQGSARAFFQDAAPTTQVDGSAFDSGDLGSLWFDSNADPDNQFNVLTATTPTWTPVSTEIIAVLLASNREFAGTLACTDFGASGNFAVTGNFAVNTDKFAVTAASGNTLVAGTLDVTGNSLLGGTLGVIGTAEVTGVATLGDGSLLKTSAAPTTDAMIANKKYVVDQDTADHPAYTGGESHTDGSGLIIKMGYIAIAGTTTTVTFETPFPNGVVSCDTQEKHAHTHGTHIVSGLTVTTLTIIATDPTIDGYYWSVIGH